MPWEPVATRVIADVETLRALAEPIRIRILETMVRDTGEGWTVKRIAKALGTGPTKLYHHIRILEENDLIRPSGQQLVRGIVETSYRIAQLELRLDRAFLSSASEEVRSSAHAALLSVFDLAREDLEAAIRSGLVTHDGATDEPGAFVLTRTIIRTTRARSIELREKVLALFREYETTNETRDETTEVMLGAFLSLHPLPEIAGAARRGNTEIT